MHIYIRCVCVCVCVYVYMIHVYACACTRIHTRCILRTYERLLAIKYTHNTCKHMYMHTYTHTVYLKNDYSPDSSRSKKQRV